MPGRLSSDTEPSSSVSQTWPRKATDGFAFPAAARVVSALPHSGVEVLKQGEPMLTRRGGHGRPAALVATLTAIAVLVLAAPSSAAPTPVLYGATGGNTASNLYTIDPGTGASTAVGAAGAIGFAVTGLAQDPTDGTLYGMTSSRSPGCVACLIKIDRSTGVGTLVGPTGLGSSPADIAIDASGQLFGWSEDTDDLVKTDRATGTATIVSDSGASTFGDGMSFNRDGVLYAMTDGDNGDLWTVNTSTGTFTVVGTLNGGPARGAAIAAASYACDRSTLYAIDNNFGTAPNLLVTVDTATGAVTTIGDTGQANMDALEWYCPTEFSVAADAASVNEAAGSATFTGTRAGGVKGSMSVNYATANGTAQAGSDYTATSGTLTWADNETGGKKVTVPITNDTADEPDETFSLNLGSPTGGATLATASATTTI